MYVGNFPPSSLSSTYYLSHSIWDTVAVSVPLPDEEEHKENDVAEVREQEGGEDDDDGGREEKQVDVTNWQEPTQRLWLNLPSRVEVPVRLSAAFYRHQRGNAPSGSTIMTATQGK